MPPKEEQAIEWAAHATLQLEAGVLPILALIPAGEDATPSNDWLQIVDTIRQTTPWLPIIDLHCNLRFYQAFVKIETLSDQQRSDLYLDGMEGGLHELFSRIAMWRQLLN